MTLVEIYGDKPDELDMHVRDLEGAVQIINDWLDGEEIDPDLAHYIGMMCLSISERALELSEELEGEEVLQVIVRERLDSPQKGIKTSLDDL